MKYLTLQGLKNVCMAVVLLAVCASSFGGKDVSGSLALVESSSSYNFLAEGESVPENQIIFDVTFDGRTKKGASLMVYTTCWQSTGAVFQDRNTTDYTLTLDNETGYWNTAEPAECISDLIYMEWQGKERKDYYLDRLVFEVSAVFP